METKDGHTAAEVKPRKAEGLSEGGSPPYRGKHRDVKTSVHAAFYLTL